jgi:hypothetical protein
MKLGNDLLLHLIALDSDFQDFICRNPVVLSVIRLEKSEPIKHGGNYLYQPLS